MVAAEHVVPPKRSKIGPALASPAQQLMLDLALHRLLASHAALPVEAGMTSAAAEGRARVLFRLLQLQAAMRVSAELAGGIHASGLLIVARSPSPRPAAATRRVTLAGGGTTPASRLALQPGLLRLNGAEMLLQSQRLGLGQRGLAQTVQQPARLARQPDQLVAV